MSTPAYVNSESITQADGAQSSRPEEAPSEAEELQSLGSRVPLMGEEFVAVGPSVSFHYRIARMAVRTQPTLSPAMSARVAKAAALSPSSFCKRYRSSYETSSSSSLTFPVRKRYRDTSELILDTDSEGDELGDMDIDEDEEDESSDADDEGDGSDDESRGLDDESYSVESNGLGLEEEDEAIP
ncbi:hypothetical protein Tco_0950014 [Tanacetum coccineum]